MSKRVIMIASGETERRALPHLVRHLRDQDVVAEDVRTFVEAVRNGSGDDRLQRAARS